MRFFADENVYPKVISHLREIGHDVKDIRSSNLSSVSDEEILEFCRRDQRALITFDKHFTNILGHPPENTFGIVVVRIHPPTLREVEKALERFLKESNFETLKGKLIVLTRKGYRIRGISQ
ncbi:MAG TPA: DUF5615 family PIN-like protein [Candidatus Hypogeohydataceae bacterium YC41]